MKLLTLAILSISLIGCKVTKSEFTAFRGADKAAPENTEEPACIATRVQGGVSIQCGDTTQFISDGQNGSDGLNGIDGEKGMTGSQGPQGVPGVDGPKGERGLTGPQGIQGVKGDAGVSAIKPQVYLVPTYGKCVKVRAGVYVKNDGTHVNIYNNASCKQSGGNNRAYCSNLTDGEISGADREICTIVFSDQSMLRYSVTGTGADICIIEELFEDLPTYITLD